jgi:hypothetical protein
MEEVERGTKGRECQEDDVSEWPELKPLEKPVENEQLRRLAWLIGGTAAEEWTEGHTYGFNPNPAVREALEIIVALDRTMAQKAD